MSSRLSVGFGLIQYNARISMFPGSGILTRVLDGQTQGLSLHFHVCLTINNIIVVLWLSPLLL
ncbi:MAG: hypothetical protein SPI30_08240 [Prevotella sp.]|nr:hypothetical protein [Prevotella sp.]